MATATPVTVYRRAGGIARAARLADIAVDGLVGLLAAAGAVSALLGVVALWSLALCVPLAAVGLGAAWRGLRAVISPVQTVAGPIERAELVGVSTPRATYRLWQVAVSGRSFEFPARGREADGSVLQPGRLAHAVLLAGGELLSLTVEASGRAEPLPAALTASSPAPLSADDLRVVRRWAQRELTMDLALVVAVAGALVIAGSVSPVLAGLVALLLLGAGLRAVAGLQRLRWASSLPLGTATVVVAGPATRVLGPAGEVRIAGRRVEAAAPLPVGAPGAALRGRAVACPAAPGSAALSLVVVGWEAASR